MPNRKVYNSPGSREPLGSFWTSFAVLAFSAGFGLVGADGSPIGEPVSASISCRSEPLSAIHTYNRCWPRSTEAPKSVGGTYSDIKVDWIVVGVQGQT